MKVIIGSISPAMWAELQWCFTQWQVSKAINLHIENWGKETTITKKGKHIDLPFMRISDIEEYEYEWQKRL